MASQYFAILTDYGTRAIAHALSQGQPLQLTQFAVGDGNGQAVTPTASATALVHQTHIAPVSAVSLDPRNNKQVIVELTIPENVGGFYIREMGVFDAQNKLIAYANCPESFKPTESSGSGKVQVLRMILKVESSSAVTLSIDHSVIFVTRQQMAPKTITATTQNGFDENGHCHEIAKASTTQQGIVQLTNDTGLESESLALTAKAGKKLAQLIATVQLALNNYIPLNKRSSAVNSNDENNVATSKAVKTAYDKGVEAKTAADNAQRSANDGINRANNAQSSANKANNNANGRVSKSGDTMTGHLIIKDGDYSSVRTYNNDGESVRWESTPANNNDIFAKIVLAGKNEQVISSIHLPKKNGTAALLEDVNKVKNDCVPYNPNNKNYAQVIANDSGYGGYEITGGKNNGTFRLECEDNHIKFWSNVKGIAYAVHLPGEKNGTIALQESVDNLKKDVYNKSRFSHRYYANHYEGAEVYDMPIGDREVMRVIIMGATIDGYAKVSLPERFSGTCRVMVMDVGSGRHVVGANIQDYNKVEVHNIGRTGLNIMAIGYYSW